MRAPSPSGQNDSTSTESMAVALKLTERHVCTIRRFDSVCRIVPDNKSLKARNGVPGLDPMLTGAPVKAAWSCGSRYISKSRSGAAGKDAATTIFFGI